jgi:hypothetical protein
VTDHDVAVDDILRAMTAAPGGGLSARGRRLAWPEVAGRAREFVLGLRAAGIGAGATIDLRGPASVERLCVDLGAIAAGCRSAGDAADVVVSDRPEAASSRTAPIVVVLADSAPPGAATLERFAARGIAWAASNPAPALTGVVETAPLGLRVGDHVLVHADVAPADRCAAIAAAGAAGADVTVVEGDLAAIVGDIRPVAIVAPGPVLDRLAAAVAAQVTRHRPGEWLAGHQIGGTRVRRLLARDAIGDRLRLAVSYGPSTTSDDDLARLGVTVVRP